MAHGQKFNSGNVDWMLMDRIDGIWWGAAFLWGAVVLLLANTGWPGLPGWFDSWGVFFVGIGLFALLCAVARLQMPEYRPKWVSSLLFGLIFLAIGLGAWDAGWWFWALALLMLGAVTLRSALNRKT
ncbi:MAG: hypothetical protein P8N14_01810 [Sulfitobacter sp.]|jgi:hypothetical protein|nr:hypothetical protein [Sulfitobacter sp.]